MPHGDSSNQHFRTAGSFLTGAVNVLTDTAVVSGVANILIDWTAGGLEGRLLTFAATGVYAATRALGEYRKAAGHVTGNSIIGPKLTLIVQGCFQLAIMAFTAYHTGASRETFIFLLGCLGNFMAALPFDKTKDSLLEKAREKNEGKNPFAYLLPMLGYLLLDPNLYWTSAFMIIGNPAVMPVFAAAAAFTFLRALIPSMPEKVASVLPKRAGNLVRGEDFPLMMITTGLVLSAGASLLTGNLHQALITTLYAIGGVSIYAVRHSGGVVEMFRPPAKQASVPAGKPRF